MRRIGAWSLVAALGAVNAACAYNRPIPEAPLAVAGGPAAPLSERWLLRAGRGMSLPLVIDQGRLFGVGIDRRVVAVDLARGKEQWVFRLDGPAASGVLLLHDTIISGSERPGGEVVALMAATGRRGWKRRIGWISAPLALVGNVVVAQTHNHGIWGIDASSGRTKWRLPLFNGRHSALLGGADVVILAAADSLYRVETDSGRVQLRIAAPGSLAADWLPTGRGILAGTGEGEILLIDPTTLATIWRHRLDGSVLVTPMVSADTAWTVTQANTIWRTELASGASRIIIHHPAPITAPLARWDGALLVSDAKGIITAYEPDGNVRWRLAVGRPVEVAPFGYEEDLIVIGGRGDVHRFAK